MCAIDIDACVLKTMVVDQLCMFQTGRRQTTEVPTLGQAHTVSNPKNMEQVENYVHDDTHQTICSVNGTDYEHRHCTFHHTDLGTSTRCVPSGSNI
jgi:hypothetical protein